MNHRSTHHSPTFPVTDAISFAGSKPTPCLNTVSTLRTSAMVVDGSPSMTTRSACLPAAIDADARVASEILRAVQRADRIASSGVNPSSTSSSSCRWFE